MNIWDVLFPKRCITCRRFGEYLCSSCFSRVSFSTSFICVVCNRASWDGKTHPGCQGKYALDGAFASLVYKGAIKKVLYQYKYEPYLTDVTEFLTDLFYEGITQHEIAYQILSRKPLFVPIPMHPTKLRQRGYNQSLLLARSLAKRCGVNISDCLQRVKKTPTQTKLSREERIQNVKDAFSLYNKCIHEFQGKEIVLIDDVMTSGATFNAACNVLKRAGADKVWGMALCHEE